MDIFMLAKESHLFILKVSTTPVEMCVAYSVGWLFCFFFSSLMWQTL